MDRDMMTICEKCGRKITPIFRGHIFDGTESIQNGSERVFDGSEYIRTGEEITISDYTCPFCGHHHASGTAKKKGGNK